MTNEGWLDGGPGACRGEVIRMKNFANGTLVAVVRQTKGYKPVSVANPNPKDELVVVNETTLSMSFMPGVRIEAVPAQTEANSPAPSPESDAASPAPAPVGAAPPT